MGTYTEQDNGYTGSTQPHQEPWSCLPTPFHSPGSGGVASIREVGLVQGQQQFVVTLSQRAALQRADDGGGEGAMRENGGGWGVGCTCCRPPWLVGVLGEGGGGEGVHRFTCHGLSVPTCLNWKGCETWYWLVEKQAWQR